MHCKISCNFISKKNYSSLFGGFKISDYKMLLESYKNSHYTFEQACFKRDFVLMNKKSRQNAKNAIKKDFLKLMNNANFGFDCRNNANNTKFEPIIEEINEIGHIKKYYNLFDNKGSEFVNSDVFRTAD